MGRLPTIAGLLCVLSCGADPAPEIRRLGEALAAEEARFPAAPADPRPAPDGTVDGAVRAMRAATGGAGFDRFATAGFRAAFDSLASLVAADRLTPEEGERAEAALAGLLATDPPAVEAWWGTSLEVQARLRDRLAGNPRDSEALAAWATLRGRLDPGGPDLAGLRRAAKASGNPVLAEAAAEVLLAAERAPAVDEGLKRDLEALILAIRVNRHRAAAGDWPADLEALRPASVPASPGGGRWELAPDPATKRTAVFLRGGRRFGAAQTDGTGFHASGPEKPLFTFER